jgi:hypothetical protein
VPLDSTLATLATSSHLGDDRDVKRSIV